MAKRKYTIPVYGFTGGINLEASVLNALPSEMTEGTVNVELFKNGTVRPRRGVDFIGESDAGGYLQTIRTTTSGNEPAQESINGVYVRMVAPNGELVNKLVLDLNNKFYIYDFTYNSLRNFDSPTQTIDRTGYSDELQRYHYLSMRKEGNKIFFTGKYCQPGYLTIGSDNTSFDITYYDVIVSRETNTGAGTRVEHISRYWECIEEHSSAAENAPGTTVGAKYWMPLDNVDLSSTTNAWAAGSAYVTRMVKEFPKDPVSFAAGNTRPCTCEFYAGRVWLAKGNKLYYSQVIASDEDIYRFHQFADPFDTTDPDLVADDGGVIIIQGATEIHQLLSVGTSLYVGYDDGVREIGGADGIFRATDFYNRLVLGSGILGPSNMCRAGDKIFICTRDGVYTSSIKKDIIASDTVFTSMSDDRVQSMYSAIPDVNKASAHCVYNPKDKKAYFFFNRYITTFVDENTQYSQPGYFSAALVFDLSEQRGVLESQTSQLDAQRSVDKAITYYEYNEIGSSEEPYLALPFIAPSISAANQNVIVGSDNVVVGTDNVVVQDPQINKDVQTILFITLKRTTVAGGLELSGAVATSDTSDVVDWGSSSTDRYIYPVELHSGIQTMGNLMSVKSPRYMYFVFEQGDNQGCNLYTAAQFSTTSSSSKYSGPYPIYKDNRLPFVKLDDADDGINHVWFKHRVRSRGNVFQIILKRDGTKDFKLIGWAQDFHVATA